jgi:hypothetical protein
MGGGGVTQSLYVSLALFSGSSMVVGHLPHQPKVEGSSPIAATSPGEKKIGKG